MSKINRRAVLAGAASAAVTAPAIAASAEPDPIFAAIEAYKFNLAPPSSPAATMRMNSRRRASSSPPPPMITARPKWWPQSAFIGLRDDEALIGCGLGAEPAGHRFFGSGCCSSRRRWRSRPMNHPITNAANRNAMITPMLTST